MASRNAHTLYGSTNESSCVPDAAPGALGRLAGEPLADALSVWECYEDRPADGAPLLLRFEMEDLVVAPAGEGRLAMHLGAVDTDAQPAAGGLPRPIDDASQLAAASSPVAAAARDDAATGPDCADEGACLAWLPARDLADALGQEAAQVSLEADGSLRVELEDALLRVRSRGGRIDAQLGPRPRTGQSSRRERR